MADTKISALPASTTPLTGTETLPIVQGGVTKKVSVADLTAGRAVAMAGGLFTDNITQGTAAKGINFIANTPAAGMASQLLNWYEEGTWTPTVTAVNGTITTVSATGTYTRIGRQVTLGINIDLSNNGTGSGAMRISGMPFNAASTWQEAGVGREYQSTGNAITLQFSATNTIQMQNYDNAYPGGSGYKFSASIAYNV